MSIDRVTHLLEQMHRSEDDMGNPIAADKVLVTDGATGFTWEDYDPSSGTGLDTDIVRWLDLGLSGSAFTVDWSAAPSQYVELDDDTDATLTGIPATVDGETVEGRGRLWVETDGTHTVTWPVTVVWQDSAPDLSVAGLYFVDFVTFDGGTNFYGVFGGGAGSALSVEDEGSELDPAVTSIDFVGAGVTATNVGSAVTVTIPGSSATIWRPVMAFDPDLDMWFVVVDGDGTAVMAEG